MSGTAVDSVDSRWYTYHYRGMHTTDILCLGRIYATATGRRLTTVGRHIAGHGAFFTRLDAGCGITLARAARVVQRLSDHWPEGAEWPSDIPRPAPTSPDGEPNPPAGGQGPASLSSAPAVSAAGVPARGGPDTAAPARPGAATPAASAGPAASLKRPKPEATDEPRTAPSAGPAVPAAAAGGDPAAWPLDARGHIRDVAGFARTCGVRVPETVYTTIARYADAGPRAHRWPRGRGCDTERVLRALLASGDARFRQRRARTAALAGPLAAAARHTPTHEEPAMHSDMIAATGGDLPPRTLRVAPLMHCAPCGDTYVPMPEPVDGVDPRECPVCGRELRPSDEPYRG